MTRDGETVEEEIGHAATEAGASGAAGVSAPLFRPGNLLTAGRYKIVRFLARGGMGEVYAAEDLLLHEKIALKTIRADLAADVQAMARFRREIQMARKVTSPSVCRIFDLGVHEDVAFLTMELLGGETLADRIKRAGPMKPREARPIIEQMAGALAAAHKAGVVHRDFKSQNVMLVPAGAETRVVVTDFGLARPLTNAGVEGASMTGGGFVGTPAYMAPEQVAGAETGAAADLYALGVVIYELVTGKLPFAGDSPMAIAVKRLREPPPAPRTYVADLDPRWEAAILRCLEQKPSARFASAEELVCALAPSAPARGRTRTWLALLTVFVIAGAIIAWRMHARAPDPSGRRSVAVIGLRNLAAREDTAWISTAVAEMLATDLAAGERLRIIPGEAIADARRDLAFVDADAYTRETLDKLRARLGADYVIVGSYLAQEDKLRLDLRIQNAVTGEDVAVVEEEGAANALSALVGRAGARVREKVGAGALSARVEQSVEASLPANAEAARYYAEGIESARLFNFPTAVDSFQRAVDADPKFALGMIALAESLAGLGDSPRAHETARRAVELSVEFPSAEKLAIEARADDADSDKLAAVGAYERLFALDPGNLENGIRLVQAQSIAWKWDAARATIAVLRRLPPPASIDFRIDWSEANVAMDMGDFDQGLLLSRRLTARARSAGIRSWIAKAERTEGLALGLHGQVDEAIEELGDAARLCEEMRDLGCLPDVLKVRAGFEQDKGDLDAARADLTRAEGVMGPGSFSWYDVYVKRAAVEFMAAELATSLEAADRAIAEHVRPGHPEITVWARFARAGALLELGRLDAAVDEARRAREAQLKEFGKVDVLGEDIVEVTALVEQDDAAAARRFLEPALAATTNEVLRRYCGWALARIDVADGRYDEAADRLRAALAVAQGVHDTTSIRQEIAAALRLAGRLDEARKELAPALDAVAKFPQMALMAIAVKIEAAAEQAPSDPAAARRALGDLIAQCAAKKLVRLELHARLALGQIDADRAQLAKLATDAEALGFKQIARLARQQ